MFLKFPTVEANRGWLWNCFFPLLTEPDFCFCAVLGWRPEGSWEIQGKWLQPILSLVLWHHRLLHWNQRCKTQRCCGSEECGDGGMQGTRGKQKKSGYFCGLGRTFICFPWWWQCFYLSSEVHCSHRKHLQVCEALCFQSYEQSYPCVADTKFCM